MGPKLKIASVRFLLKKPAKSYLPSQPVADLKFKSKEYRQMDSKWLLIGLVFSSGLMCTKKTSDDNIDDKPHENLSTDAEKKPDKKEKDSDHDADMLEHSGLIGNISIKMDQWDELKNQEPTKHICQPDSHYDRRGYTYFVADIEIDGEFFETIGIRKKGHCGSKSNTKPALKIKLSKYVSDQEHNGHKSISLNNNIQDPALIRQCLGYRLLSELDIQHRECQLVRVTVNDVYYGIYSRVEDIKSKFLEKNFGKEKSGHVLLESGSVDTDFDGGFNFFERKEIDHEEDYSIHEVITNDIQARQLDAVKQYFDLGHFYKIWAGEILLMHIDGYVGNNNNFYVYRRKSDSKFHFIISGIDRTWEKGQSGFEQWKKSIIASLAREDPEFMGKFKDRLTGYWARFDTEDFFKKATELQDAVMPYLPDEEHEDFRHEVNILKEYVANHHAEIERYIDSL